MTTANRTCATLNCTVVRHLSNSSRPVADRGVAGQMPNRTADIARRAVLRRTDPGPILVRIEGVAA